MNTYHIFLNKLLTCIAFLFLFAAGSQLYGADNTHYKNSIDQKVALNSAGDVTSERFPNADVVLVDGHHWKQYHADGTYEQVVERYEKILTDTGREHLRSLTSYFSSHYEDMEFSLIEICRADGSIVKVDIGANSRVAVESDQMEMNIYDPRQKELQVILPPLEIGDVVYYVIHDRCFKARVPGAWFDTVGFEDTDPIVRLKYTVVAPRSLPLAATALRDEVPGTVTHTVEETGNFIIYNWVARDVPRAFYEPNMPPMHSVAQRLLVSTVADWRQLSRWYWGLSRPQIERSHLELENTVTRGTAGTKTPVDKMAALYRWVAQEIRYLGLTLETETPGFEPHPVAMTFDRRLFGPANYREHGLIFESVKGAIPGLDPINFDSF